MDGIKINTVGVSVPVERDGENTGAIVFNPSDVGFAERYYKMLADFESKEKEFIAKGKTLDEQGGSPAEGLALIREICAYFKVQIDALFGEGTSEAAFGNACTFDMFAQFFAGITPYIQEARMDKISRYTENREQRRAVLK